MQIFVDFDLILVTIFVTIFITGYIRGAGIELLRVLKVIIPFFILYFYGDEIMNLLFSSHDVAQFVYDFLPDVPYKNTIAAFSTKIGVYLVVYTFLTIFLWRLGKFVLDERIEYFFGRYNSIFGGIFSLIRMYIIVSILIIPFYAFNFTNHEDPLTSFILNHPPNFSKIGILIDKSKPTIDKMNDFSSSIKIMDLNNLDKYSMLLVDVKEFLTENEALGYELYQYLKDEHMMEEDYTKEGFLLYYVNHLDDFKNLDIYEAKMDKVNQQLFDNVSDYHQVVIWAYENDVKELDDLKEIVDSFIENYPTIEAKTDDQLTIDVLAKIKLKTQVYLVMKNWLYDSFHIELSHNNEILDDENLEKILDEFHLHKDVLINDIQHIKAEMKDKEELINQINKFADFQEEYLTTYKKHILIYDTLLEDVSLKYKLLFSIVKEKSLYDLSIEDDPLVYIVLTDTIEFLNIFSQDQDIYYTSGQIYVSLFLVDLETGSKEIDSLEIINQIKILQNEEDLYQKTRLNLNKIIYTLLSQGYISMLLENGYLTSEDIEILLNSEEVINLLTISNYKLLERTIE